MALRNKFIAVMAGLLLSVAAFGDEIVIDLTGAYTVDGAGDGDNLIWFVDIGGGSEVEIDGIGWDLSIEALGASWLSEATIGFGSPGGANDITLAAGSADDFPGTGTYTSGGIINLEDAGIPNLVLSEGVLQIEFFESFVDVEGEIEAYFDGTLTVSTAVPEPGTLALLGLGLAGLGLSRRRRKV